MVDHFLHIMNRGGFVMWPLLVLSVVGLTLAIERAWFWWRQNGTTGRRNFLALMDSLRVGDRSRAQALSEMGATVYARVCQALLKDGTSDAVAVGSVEHERIKMDRYMATLSTIITAGPMLGILGTVTGIIDSFEVLSGGEALVDPKAVSGGISEALVATASGLIVALMALFPYMAFGAQRETAVGRLETLISVAQIGLKPTDRGGSPASTPSAPSAPYS